MGLILHDITLKYEKHQVGIFCMQHNTVHERNMYFYSGSNRHVIISFFELQLLEAKVCKILMVIWYLYQEIIGNFSFWHNIIFKLIIAEHVMS